MTSKWYFLSFDLDGQGIRAEETQDPLFFVCEKIKYQMFFLISYLSNYFPSFMALIVTKNAENKNF